MTYLLQMFSEGTINSLVDSFSFHTLLSMSRVTVASAAFTLQASLSSAVANNGTYLEYPQKTKIKGTGVRRTRWSGNRPSPGNLFLWKFVIK
jgi:hypothetical protein